MNIDISDLNDIHNAITDLRSANDHIKSQLRGTNDPQYDACRCRDSTIKQALAAYDRLLKA